MANAVSPVRRVPITSCVYPIGIQDAAFLQSVRVPDPKVRQGDVDEDDAVEEGLKCGSMWALDDGDVGVDGDDGDGDDSGVEEDLDCGSRWALGINGPRRPLKQCRPDTGEKPSSVQGDPLTQPSNVAHRVVQQMEKSPTKALLADQFKWTLGKTLLSATRDFQFRAHSLTKSRHYTHYLSFILHSFGEQSLV